MKTKLLLLLTLCYSFTGFSQIVDIPDANFKSLLINTVCADFNGNGFPEEDVDTNDDGEIQVSEAQAVKGLSFDDVSGVSSLVGLSSFNNIENFRFDGYTSGYNGLDISPDFSQCLLLEDLFFNNSLTGL